ncbi:uncharacterized protein LOC133410056 [Phycodurus eques]|uniref:uncharacterized protein LOC133410056 n=1 Tax=Phycodurus eques TaxID=693459 RepID=UPI002ACDA4AC|nr:uncharacterized protein LOC133410056 [Phycodurus eques]
MNAQRRQPSDDTNGKRSNLTRPDFRIRKRQRQRIRYRIYVVQQVSRSRVGIPQLDTCANRKAVRSFFHLRSNGGRAGGRGRPRFKCEIVQNGGRKSCHAVPQENRQVQNGVKLTVGSVASVCRAAVEPAKCLADGKYAISSAFQRGGATFDRGKSAERRRTGSSPRPKTGAASSSATSTCCAVDDRNTYARRRSPSASLASLTFDLRTAARRADVCRHLRLSSRSPRSLLPVQRHRTRVALSGMKAVRPPVAIARYRTIEHGRDRGNEPDPQSRRLSFFCGGAEPDFDGRTQDRFDDRCVELPQQLRWQAVLSHK